MKKYLFFFLLPVIFIFFFLFSCEYFQLMNYKEWIKKNNKKAAVYAIGKINSSVCYWKNDNKPVYLSDCSGDALSIFVYNHDVFVSGKDMSGYASYWKNGKKVRLSSTFNSTSKAIYVVGEVVFNAVSESNVAFLLIDDIKYKYELKKPPSVIISNPKSIFVEKNGGEFNVVIGGFFRLGANYHPCYWTNRGNDIVDLYPGNAGPSDQINSVFLYSSKIYSCGSFTDIGPPVTTYGTCWIDYAPVYNFGGNIPNSIYVDKGDIYIASQKNTFYWKNGNPVYLPGTPQTFSLKVFNDDVYVGGNSVNACYWINSSGPYYFNDDGYGVSSISTTGSSIFVTWDY